MQKITLTIAATSMLAATSLTGCVPGHNIPGATITGAAAGGLLGGALFHGKGAWMGIIAGTLIGGAVGNQIGRYMDRQDALNMHSAVVNTPIGEQATWRNRKTHVTYTVKPIKNYHSRGRYCREYQTTALIAGKKQQVYGRACRMPDGTWKSVK
ncbi:MAG: hypothetical protein K0U12_04285 [Gammaproteobacteria bacterium]|nr:hypothetical protein [Gammaproteobacteria bacterium]